MTYIILKSNIMGRLFLITSAVTYRACGSYSLGHDYKNIVYILSYKTLTLRLCDPVGNLGTVVPGT
jgi:hypothetical protein